MSPLPQRPSLNPEGNPSGKENTPPRLPPRPQRNPSQPVYEPVAPVVPVAPVAQPAYIEPVTEEVLVEDEVIYEEPAAPVYETVYDDEPEEAQQRQPFSSPVTDGYEKSPARVSEDDENDINAVVASFSPQIRESAIRLLELIAGDDSSEVLMNGPSEIIFKRAGQRYFAENIDFETVETYHKVINTLILPNTDTKDRIGSDSYLVEGQLELPDIDDPDTNPPLIARVHILAPPAVQAAVVTIAKKAKYQYTLEDLLSTGSMSPNMAEVLKAFGRGRATIVFAGLSGSGKTTLLEALSHYFDPNDRIVVVEDTAELRLPIADLVAMRSSSAKPGGDPKKLVSLEWLVRQANRMRPTRIIIGEVRGAEMAEFLAAANSGADGSMTTVHASSPQQTIDRMVSLSMKAESSKNESSILRDIATTVQIIVQTSLIDGKHIISHIEEISQTLVKGGSGIATSTLFEYDRNIGAFKAVGRPSENLTNFLAQRGVSLDPAWFSRASL